MADFQYNDPPAPIRDFLRRVNLEKWTRMLTDNKIKLIQCHDGVWRPMLTEYRSHTDTPHWSQEPFIWVRDQGPKPSSAFLKNDQA